MNASLEETHETVDELYYSTQSLVENTKTLLHQTQSALQYDFEGQKKLLLTTRYQLNSTIQDELEESSLTSIKNDLKIIKVFLFIFIVIQTSIITGYSIRIHFGRTEKFIDKTIDNHHSKRFGENSKCIGEN